MSNSVKKHPAGGITKAPSEKDDKATSQMR
jgi:hypothetical protein